jgi:hypothetical protein
MKEPNFIELVLDCPLHSLDVSYLYTPIGLSLDKNAPTTTTHSKNIHRHSGLVRHMESPPVSGSAGPAEIDRLCLMLPLDRPRGPCQTEAVGPARAVNSSPGKTCKTD